GAEGSGLARLSQGGLYLHGRRVLPVLLFHVELWPPLGAAPQPASNRVSVTAIGSAMPTEIVELRHIYRGFIAPRLRRCGSRTMYSFAHSGRRLESTPVR